MEKINSLNPNYNGHCPVCGKEHKNYNDAWKCGIEAGYTLALFRDNIDIVPDEAYRMALFQVIDITEYLKNLPGYKEKG